MNAYEVGFDLCIQRSPIGNAGIDAERFFIWKCV